METLRTMLIPNLIKEECFNKYFVDYDFVDVDCFKYSLSKGLGYGIILGSILVKLPQIIKIWSNKSAAGITFISVVMELFAISSNLAYSYQSGFPFSAWGEALFLALQTSVIAALVLFYNFSSSVLASSFLVGYIAVLYALVSEFTPINVLWNMQALNVPIILVSKMLQAVTNYRNQSTGQLSAVTIFMLFGGSLARIFTSIQETGDQVVITTYLTASFANAVIAFQVLYYWNSQAAGKGNKKSTKVNKGQQNSPKKNIKKSSKSNKNK